MNRRKWLLLGLILLLAIGLRTIPLFSYEGMQGADGYYHGRLLKSYFTNEPTDVLPYATNYSPPKADVYWGINFFIYKLFFGTFSQDNLILLMKVMPVVWAVLTVLFTFLFVRKLFGENPALVSAFIMATISAFMHRTMWGFFEDDSIVFFLVVLFLFLLFSKYALWSPLPLIILLGVWAIGYLILILLFISLLIWYFKVKPKLYYPLFFVLSIFILIPSLALAPAELSHVGEEDIGITYFIENFNILIVLPLIALVLIPAEKENKYSEIFIWLLTLASLFFAFYKVKYTFILAFPIALCGGYVFNKLKDYRKVFILLLGVSLIFSFSFAFNEEVHVEKYLPALKFLDANDNNCSVFNWWALGHWITFHTDCKVYTDNSYHSPELKGFYSDFVLGYADCNDLKEFSFNYFMLPKELLEGNGLKLLRIYSNTGERKEDYSCLEEVFQDNAVKIYKVNFK